MVCGTLPFGDDTQVVQMINQPLEFTRLLTNGKFMIVYIQCVMLAIQSLSSSILSMIYTPFNHWSSYLPFVNDDPVTFV